VAWSWEGAIPDAARKSASMDGVRLATLVPVASTFEPAPCEVTAGRAYALSRFAYIRAAGGEMLLESPLAPARVVLHDWRATAIVHLLAEPCRVEELGARIPSVSQEATRALLALLLAARMASEATEAGSCAADESVALRSWEFHDLLFHARSRGGRHDQPVGGTYRFLGDLDPPPVFVRPSSERPVALYRPDLHRLEAADPPFARVQEARRSIRVYAARPLTARQLGEFLYRVGRVADYWEDELRTPRGPVRLASAARPYPSGGGVYELDLYVLVNRCDGLDAGLYRHDAERHCLHPLAAASEDLDGLLADASLATAIPRERLQVLIVVAARFQRVAWKYASIAYSVILKDVGVLYQTMYLVATAMGLAPCAVGCGNADLFARAAGVDYFAETSVGEFLLGSRETEG
jgi:SagB-type dehydrogenase family enzyme